MTELELRIREIYDLIEPRKDFVYTDKDMLEVIKGYILESELLHKKEIDNLTRHLEIAEEENYQLDDENDDLRRTISELEQEIFELED